MAYYLRSIRHATLDACSLLCLCRSMRGCRHIEKNFIEVYPVSENETFREKILFLAHNIFLNILRLFPENRRFRAAQLLNVCLFETSLAVFFFLQYLLCTSAALTTTTALTISFLSTFCLAARTRIVLVAALGLGDILNLFLFLLAAAVIHQLTVSPSLGLAALFALIAAMGFRNKAQDGLIFAAGLAVIAISGKGFAMALTSTTIFLLCTIDWFWAEFGPGNKSYRTLYAYVKMFGPFQDKDNPSHGDNGCSGKKSLVSYLLEGLSHIFHPLRDDSLWQSLGIFLPLGMAAAIILTSRGNLPPVLLFFGIHFLLVTVVLSTMRHRFVSGTAMTERFYSGSRQSYSLLPSLILFAGSTFGLAWRDGLKGQMILFLGAVVCYTVHQGLRLLGHFFSDTIEEKNLVVYHKKPEPWSVELGSFLHTLQGFAVVLGDHLLYGKALDFYHWTNKKRCLDLYAVPDAAMLRRLVDRCGVTHVVVTPISCLEDVEKTAATAGITMTRVATSSPSLCIYQLTKHTARTQSDQSTEPPAPSARLCSGQGDCPSPRHYDSFILSWTFRLLLDVEYLLQRLVLRLCGQHDHRQRILLDFNRAIALSSAQPPTARRILHGLLDILANGDIRDDWNEKRAARVWFQLALLSNQSEEKIHNLEHALYLMPEHRRAREMYQCLTGKSRTVAEHQLTEPAATS